jgi:hypothetical protein
MTKKVFESLLLTFLSYSLSNKHDLKDFSVHLCFQADGNTSIESFPECRAIIEEEFKLQTKILENYILKKESASLVDVIEVKKPQPYSTLFQEYVLKRT